MFGFAKDHKQIQVMFFELHATEPFAESELPIEQLPDTFEIETTLQLGHDDWVVHEATPPTKIEFRKTGKVCIRLYKPKTASLPFSEILYSLPSISNDFPDLVNVPSLENVFVTHEDDWRQIEVLSVIFAGAVHQELVSIRNVLETQRVGVGFRTTHLRKLIPSPFGENAPRLSDIKQLFDVSHEYSGVAFNTKAAIVVGGFAFCAADGMVLWGQATPQGLLVALCVRMNPESDASQSTVISTLLARHRLLFIDWTRLLVLPSMADETY
jgi:hypothetical protein